MMAAIGIRLLTLLIYGKSPSFAKHIRQRGRPIDTDGATRIDFAMAVTYTYLAFLTSTDDANRTPSRSRIA